ncbi:gluconate 2-dehydrogenase subunit 3 family protein [Azomonas macrocytogenes]|uniref:Gluconate 2-dehydrogenase gamma chain n=1 Tax=Azomonas macrocytogenes TaxID=69962 RepID=A0A839T4W6_AZOMA|nr:gluconate 2-dehydrogenase subunit 3 family protein [Azomonas macrocytogenes]MBB3102965.1 gluconate 2-dehydrogenase gamma chain [Azomonas macrocytogenes]
MSNEDSPNERRDFLRKSLTLIPVVTLAGASLASPLSAQESSAKHDANKPAAPASHYEPSYFTAEEWTFLHAAVARLIPTDERGPGAIEAGVPEYIDRQMGTSYANGSLWYMQGPFNANAAPEFGYQLKLSPKEVYRLGIAAADNWCHQQHGKLFAQLDAATQDAALKQFESGKVAFEQLPAKTFFTQLLQNTKEGFFCDPMHGGNKNMVGWKLINFPGARADFMDWVERDERYPFPPVSIRGERA